MADATIGALRVVLGLDTAAFEGGLSAAQKHLRGVGRQFERVGQQMTAVGAGMSVAITAPLIAAGFHLLKGSQDAAAAAAQVEAALESMGGASGKTAEELSKSAEALRNLTGIDDDDILRRVTANMLTFGNIAGSTFDRAQLAVLNLSARMEGDLQGATMMVGKALNDPVKGLAALGRAGIQFTEQQKAQIKAMAAANDMAGAQAIMLGELERQFGGAAKAAADADIWTPMKTALMDLEGAFEPIVRNVVGPVIQKVAEMTRAFAGLSPQLQGLAIAGAAIAAALGPALVVVGSVVSALGSLTAALASGGVLAGLAGFAAAAVPFVAAGAAIAAAIYVFRDDLAPIFEQFRVVAAEALGPPLQQLMAAAKQAFAALGPAVSAVVAVVGPILGALAKLFLQAFGPIVLRALQVLVTGISNAFQIIAAALRVVTALFKGDWAEAWNAAGSLVMSIVRGIGRVIESVFPGIGRIVGRMVEEVKNFLGARLGAIMDGVISKVRSVSDAFFRMYDAVVGHSYVPDMVIEVGEWMAQLDQRMVQPAQRATQTASEAFEAMRERVKASLQGVLTDRERLASDLQRQMAELDAQLAAGPARGGISQAEYDFMARRYRAQNARDSAGLDAENLTNESRDTPSFDFLDPFNRTMDRMNRAIEDSRQRFADAFAGGLEAAMRGDWQGVLRAVVGDIFGSAARRLGASLFDAGGGGKGGSLDFGAMVSSLFKGLPKFRDGGSIMPGGVGGIDSQLVQFWKSPGERVDIYSPGKDAGPMAGGSPLHFDMRGAVLTSDLLAQAEQMAATSGGNALRGARAVVPADRAKADRYKLGRRGR
ncbi:hypothetical protein [Brevundimonas sp.]